MANPIVTLQSHYVGKDSNYSKFLLKICQNLEPRIYKTSKVIQEQFYEVYEVFFITEGQVGVGYRLFNKTYFVKML